LIAIYFLLTFHPKTKKLSMKKISILCLTLLSFLFAQSQMRYLKGSLQGSQETPPTASTGSGVVIVQYNTSTKTLKLFGDYAGLSDTITGSHIHRGQLGVAGPIIADIVNSRDTTGTLSGTLTLTQPLEDSLLAGNLYANVHTRTNPGGELRAQLTVTTGQSTFLSGRLQGAQETPPDSSTAMGTVYALVDMGTDSMFVTGSYKGLTAASNAAHVHLQNPGTAGAILFPVYHSLATAGAVHAMTAVSAANAVVIATGGSYVNVHTSKYPNGEIRAQLINNTTVRYLAGNMAGINEVPPNTSAARGTVIVTYNTETNLLRLAGDYQNLSDTVVGSHIHRGGPGVAGPVIITLTNTGDSTGTIRASTTLPDSLEAELLAGNMYVNVHSALFPNGEIRTQLVATASGETQVFATNLMGSQEVPANTSAAVGNALVIVDKTTGMTYVTSAFSGINSGASAAHLHRGQVGVAGPIILPLNFANVILKTKGTVSGSGILSPALVDSMINGLTYINIHSPKFPNGVIRGQLGDLVLPLKLTYFNAYKQRNEIELIWETSEELNVSRFEIEQLNLTDKTWVTKGTVLPQGGTGVAKYSYTDMPNLFGSRYAIYRLKMIDKDGKITYSSMVKVNYEKLKGELFIQTNPVLNGELHYTITGLSASKKAEVSIIDYNGRLLLRNTVSSLMNNTLKISHLSAGMYKLVVRVDDTLLQQSFIK
jgi:hypothetical protein